MQRSTWYAILAVVALAAPIGGRAQAPAAPVAEVTLRQIATLPGIDADELVRLPNGRAVIYTVGDEIWTHDLTSQRSTLLTHGFEGNLRIAPGGDRIAFFSPSEDGKTSFVWGMPLDPITGLAAGPAQRVSVTPGDTPGFSPDGKLLAFGILAGGSNESNDLAVMPATGGTARVLAKYRNLRRTSWSADGSSILVVQGVGSTSSVDRVPLAGGPAESLISYAGTSRGQIDGSIAFYHPDNQAQSEGRVAYRTASGAQGEFRIPLQCPADRSFPACAVRGEFDSARSVWWQTARPSAVRILNMADGKVRDLLPQGEIARAASWSPDGNRIAFQELVNGQFAISVMTADGSGRRRYPVVNANGRHTRWSPNGRMLAYAVAPVGHVAVLDLATGQSRVVSSASSDRWILDFIWRPDSQSIVLTRSARSGNPMTETWEAWLDGTERRLHDFGPTLPRSGPGGFISDALMLIGRYDEQAVVSTADGTATRVAGAEHRLGWPGISRDGRQLLWLVVNSDQTFTSAQLMTSGGELLRTVNLPFAVDPRWRYSHFHPDGRHAILIGRIPGESVSKLFLLPLNGQAPRVLAQLTGRVDNVWLSPDGTTLLYDMESAPTTTIYELDASPILKTIDKR